MVAGWQRGEELAITGTAKLGAWVGVEATLGKEACSFGQGKRCREQKVHLGEVGGLFFRENLLSG